MVKVSIIVPIYNAAPTLQRCVDSLRHQSLQSIEIIFINDGSTDGSADLCDELAKQDNRIRVIHKENGGVSSARNAGIAYATGEFLGFVDADDWVDQHMFSRLVRIMDEDHTEMAVCGYQAVTAFSKGVCTDRATTEILNQLTALQRTFGNEGFKGFLCNKLFVRELIQKNQLNLDETLAYCEDLQFVYRYLKLCSTIGFDASKLYYYYIHGGNVVEQKLDQKQLAALTMFQSLLAEEKDESILLAIRRGYVSLAISFLIKFVREHNQDKSVWRTLREIVCRYQGDFLKAKEIAKRLKVYAILVCKAPILFVALKRIR